MLKLMLMSSANIFGKPSFRQFGRSLIYVGQVIEPWGTPFDIKELFENWPLTKRLCLYNKLDMIETKDIRCLLSAC